MPRLVAVTGGTGFIGGPIVRRLARNGWRVRVLTHRRRFAPEPGGPAPEIVEGSLDDDASLRRLVQGADAVVHAAGAIRARSRAAFFASNARGVERLVAALADRPAPPRVVLISTLAARAPHLSAYAASKRAGELALTRAGDTIPWTILRPPAVYGPGDRATLPFFRAVERGLGPVLGPEHARLSLLHVDDLAEAVATVLEEAATRGLVGEPDDGQPGGHAWRSLVATAARQIGRPVRLLHVPRSVLYTCGLINHALRLIPGYQPMLTIGKAREICHADWVCDRAPLMQASAWRPRASLDQGFAGTMAWYRVHGWL